MGTIVKRKLCLGGAVVLSVGLVLALTGASASAAVPEFVLRMPQSNGVPGLSAEAGGTNNPRGIAANPSNGRIYVADHANNRINEYTPWGLFVKAWGWDVSPEGTSGDTASDELEVCGPAKPEAEPPSGLCQAGDAGAGEGQLSQPRGLAIDVTGNVYLFDSGNRRVQKFSPDGQFLLMFGGDVNQTKVETGAPAAQRNVCPIDTGDVCQAGISGEGPSQLDSTLGDFVAYSATPANAILVGDKGSIQIFNLDGTYREEISFDGPLATLAGKQVNGLDVDEDGNIYITLDATEDVYKLSLSGEPLSPGEPGADESSFDVKEPRGVAVDAEGSVYAIEGPGTLGGGSFSVLKYSAAGAKLIPTSAGEVFPETPEGASLTAIATNICAGSEPPGNLYVGVFNSGGGLRVSYVDAYGTGPVGCEPPPLVPPVIGEQFAAFVGREEATLRALINPKFWTDATYYVEYGPGRCSEGGCPNIAPLSPAPLTEGAVNAFIATAGVTLESLAPDTTYHYRFVAQSSGGGPVFGVDPDASGPLAPSESGGLEATFTTHADKGAFPACPNDAFRIGPGANLPDCRAYEMVSPLDKGNADVALGIARNNVGARLFETNKTNIAADRFTFTSATAFGDSVTAPFSSQYLAERGEGGWRSEGISPPRTESGIPVDFTFGAEFQGFRDDLCRTWLRLYSVAPLTPDAVAKYPNLYRRDNCAEPPAYTALTLKDEPPKLPVNDYTELLVIQGFSEDGSHTIFTAPDKIHPTAPTPDAEEPLLYEKTPHGLRFVCFLPSGKAVSEACAAGTSVIAGQDLSPLHNAISADGSRIFWSAFAAGGSEAGHPGRIYVRIDGKETVAVSVPISPDPAFFWTAADDGSKALFQFVSGERKGELYEFDVDTEVERLIAQDVEGPMGASEDASRIYFASTEDLDAGGPASAGAHNLYLHEVDSGGAPGSTTFIMALADEDVGFLSPSVVGAARRPVELLPPQRMARVTPDGLHATFMSATTPSPTGYDNRDAAGGKAATEVYRYDAAARQLICVSCNPTGARPSAILSEGVLAAARIQGWEALNHAPRVISDDGSRVFFESAEALVPEDANGTWDVYQWEEPGKGTCTTARSTYTEAAGGCVDPISSGQSPARSLFLDADSSGDNVFLGTQSSLVGSDYGLNDVYVARVGGGFPEPVPPSECEGAACQSPPPPPATAPRGSEAFRGPGNKGKRKCPKGKRRVVRKGRARCIKKRSLKRRKASQHRRSRR